MPVTKLTDQQKYDLAVALHVGWGRYSILFGEPLHGTLKQLRAFIELLHLDDLIGGIQNRAVAKWYADGQGKGNHET